MVTALTVRVYQSENVNQSIAYFLKEGGEEEEEEEEENKAIEKLTKTTNNHTVDVNLLCICVMPQGHPYVPVGVPQFVIFWFSTETHHFSGIISSSNTREFKFFTSMYCWHRRDSLIKAFISATVLLYWGIISMSVETEPSIWYSSALWWKTVNPETI